ncbi:MAG: TonB-dependent receptor, partial [Gemmatimonadales bacterium]
MRGQVAAPTPSDSAPARDSSLGRLATVVPSDPEEVPGLSTPSSRYTLTRDSLVWSSAVTLSDVLERVPGVFVARTGFTGLPEYVVYGGRGAAALEIFWDGVPYVSLGADTSYVDPSLITLWNIQRIDVEPLPGRIRIYLVSERHGDLRPRTQVNIVTGDFGTGGYTALFQKRWPVGLGVDVGGDFLGSDGASGPGRSDNRTDLWAKASWNPDPTTGATFQIRRQRIESDAVTADNQQFGVLRRDATRRDVSLVLHKSSRPHGEGIGLRLGLLASAWFNDSLVDEQKVRTSFATLGVAGRRLSAEITGRVSDRWIASEIEARVGLVPLDWVAVSALARARALDGDRSDRRIDGSISLYRGPAFVTGTVSTGDIVQSPA